MDTPSAVAYDGWQLGQGHGNEGQLLCDATVLNGIALRRKAGPQRLLAAAEQVNSFHVALRPGDRAG